MNSAVNVRDRKGPPRDQGVGGQAVVGPAWWARLLPKLPSQPGGLAWSADSACPRVPAVGGGPSVPSGLSLDLLVSPWPQQKPSIHAGSKPTLSSSLEDAPARTETLAATRVGSPSPPRRLRCLQGSGQTPRWMLADSVRHPEHRRHRAPSSQFRSVVSDSVTPWTGGLWSGLEFLFKELHTVLFSALHSSCVSSDHHVCITYRGRGRIWAAVSLPS